MLFRDFNEWVGRRRAAIESSAGGRFDVAVLLTGHEFAFPVEAIAPQGWACSGDFDGVIVSVNKLVDNFESACTAPDPAVGMGNLIGHELAHTLNAGHEQPIVCVDAGAGNAPLANAPLMCPAVPRVASASFSSRTASQVNNWFDSSTYPASGCLSNAARAPTTTPHCGDGIREGCEECDPGVDIADACCDKATCKLKAGCICE